MRKTKGGKTSTVVKDRYNKKAYDQIGLRVKKGNKSIIEDFASRAGESVNSYITSAVFDRMKKEGLADQAEPENLD